MEKRNEWGWIGKVKIEKIDTITGKKTVKIIMNRLMDNALDEILKSLYLLTNSNMYLRHIAIGDDNTANSDDLENLYNEVYRVPVVSRLKTGTGQLESRGILLDNEPPDEDGGSPDMSGITTIKEIGFFAGTTSLNWNSGVGKDTGLMISRIILTGDDIESKTATEQINITRTDEFIRG